MHRNHCASALKQFSQVIHNLITGSKTSLLFDKNHIKRKNRVYFKNYDKYRALAICFGPDAISHL